MNHREISAIYDHHYNPTLALLFDLAKCPIETRAEGVYVYDDEGGRYLDFSAGYGVFSVGHANPRVREAVLKQLERMAVAPALAFHEPSAVLMTKLASLLPKELTRFFLCGSGSEAVEIALRIAGQAQPNRTRLVAVDHGFHGKTLGATGVCGQSYLRTPFEPIWDDVRFVPYGDISAMKAAIGEGASAVLVEAVLGGGFITVPPPGYLAELRAICDRTNTTLVIDEVQTGFARTGKMFAIEHDGVVPDILILSKGMTGGHCSMAAAIVRETLLQSLPPTPADDDPLAYASDTGGAPLACAGAAAAIQFIIDERLPQRAAENGPYLTAGLKKAANKFPKVALDAPGVGLMTGLKVRNNMVENALWLQMLKRKVVTGLSTNPVTPSPVMRFFAPLVATREHMDVALEALDESLKELDRFPGRILDLANEAAKHQFKLPKPALRAIAMALG